MFPAWLPDASATVCIGPLHEAAHTCVYCAHPWCFPCTPRFHGSHPRWLCYAPPFPWCTPRVHGAHPVFMLHTPRVRGSHPRRYSICILELFICLSTGSLVVSFFVLRRKQPLNSLVLVCEHVTGNAPAALPRSLAGVCRACLLPAVLVEVLVCISSWLSFAFS